MLRYAICQIARQRRYAQDDAAYVVYAAMAPRLRFHTFAATLIAFRAANMPLLLPLLIFSFFFATPCFRFLLRLMKRHCFQLFYAERYAAPLFSS